MSRWKTLNDFEKKFPSMTVEELRSWLTFWKHHADMMGPKVKKLAMKRVHRIERAIEQREA